MSDKTYYKNYVIKQIPKRTNDYFEETQLKADIRNSCFARQVCNYNIPVLNAPCNLLNQSLGRVMTDDLFENPRRPMQASPPIYDADILCRAPLPFIYHE
jgi:hypothetical protein